MIEKATSIETVIAVKTASPISTIASIAMHSE